jgi:hypothetical protein
LVRPGAAPVIVFDVWTVLDSPEHHLLVLLLRRRRTTSQPADRRGDARAPVERGLAFVPPAGYVLFWATGLVDNQLGGLLGSRSATGLGERLMSATYVVQLLAARDHRAASGDKMPALRTRGEGLAWH